MLTTIRKNTIRTRIKHMFMRILDSFTTPVIDEYPGYRIVYVMKNNRKYYRNKQIYKVLDKLLKNVEVNIISGIKIKYIIGVKHYTYKLTVLYSDIYIERITDNASNITLYYAVNKGPLNPDIDNNIHHSTLIDIISAHMEKYSIY